MAKVTNEMLQESFGTTNMTVIEQVLKEWHDECGCEATDGCWVEPDGDCEHGHPSWLKAMGWM